MPSSSVFRALTWRRRTATATAERKMSAVGVRTASTKLRQQSALSPASSKASGGARVVRGGEVVEETFDHDGTCIYRHGRRHIAIMQVPLTVHVRVTCGGHVTHWKLSHDPTYATTVGVVVPASPGFRHKGWSIKIRFKVCLCIFC